MLNRLLNTTDAPKSSRRDRSTRELIGVVDHVKWHDPDEGLIIAGLRSGEIVKGTIDTAPLTVGNTYRFLGRWDEHHKHGVQFHFQTFTMDTPHNRTGVVKYLIDECPAVGRKRAEDLWEAFGTEAVTIIRTDPARVAATGILNFETATEAAEALEKIAAIESTKIDLFGLLAGRGFPGKLIKRCIEKWGARSPAVIRRNPFTLLIHRLPGAGFKRCDKMYLQLGLPRASIKRQALCIWNFLRSSGSGDTWFAGEDIARHVVETISKGEANPLAAAKLAKRAKLISVRKDDTGKTWCAEAHKARNEWTISERIRDLTTNAANGPLAWPSPDELPVELSDHQKQTAAVVLSSAVGILAGTPGTGKTYTAAAIIKLLAAKYGFTQIGVCAPTGKAAVRLTSVLGQYGILEIEATTIHRMLRIGRNGHDGDGWGFIHGGGNPLPYKFIVCDETSMVDTDLMGSLLSACGTGTHVLFIGDPYQLAPVGHGAPLRDMIASGAVAYGELREIRRNAGAIVHACAAIKDNRPVEFSKKYNADTGDNLRIIETANAAESIETLQALLEKFERDGLFDPIWETQVLIAVNAKSELSRHELNPILQYQLNVNGKRLGGNPFWIGDKIICLKNSQHLVVKPPCGSSAFDADAANNATNATNATNWDIAKDIDGEPLQEFVANGETGRVLSIAKKLTIAEFLCPRRIIRIVHGKVKDEGDGEGSGSGGDDSSDSGSERSGAGCDFDLAYAITVHKAQGSEMSAIVCVVDEYGGAKRIAERSWWYTAISRAKRLCVLIGKRGVFDQQRRRLAIHKRKTFLKELLAPKD